MTEGDTEVEPEGTATEPTLLLIEALVALVLDHDSVVLAPGDIEFGDALSDPVGADAAFCTTCVRFPAASYV